MVNLHGLHRMHGLLVYVNESNSPPTDARTLIHTTESLALCALHYKPAQRKGVKDEMKIVSNEPEDITQPAFVSSERAIALDKVANAALKAKAIAVAVADPANAAAAKVAVASKEDMEL
ncbi:unnamed protein product [Ceratitis capitata]|uniref:(Mediterranean fruit fly) hypothetical protein n=1 Tax=Ceratitis capitata TaxID=7213 RepID=A0A811U1B8_CERCA|nr:unnamed protein product [Ceratitis capitata]